MAREPHVSSVVVIVLLVLPLLLNVVVVHCKTLKRDGNIHTHLFIYVYFCVFICFS